MVPCQQGWDRAVWLHPEPNRRRALRVEALLFASGPHPDWLLALSNREAVYRRAHAEWAIACIEGSKDEAAYRSTYRRIEGRSSAPVLIPPKGRRNATAGCTISNGFEPSHKWRSCPIDRVP